MLSMNVFDRGDPFSSYFFTDLLLDSPSILDIDPFLFGKLLLLKDSSFSDPDEPLKFLFI